MFAVNQECPFRKVFDAGSANPKAKAAKEIFTQSYNDCRIVIANLLAALSSETPTPGLITDDPETASVFTNPRITGTIILGLCNILYWNFVGYGDLLQKLLTKIIERAVEHIPERPKQPRGPRKVKPLALNDEDDVEVDCTDSELAGPAHELRSLLKSAARRPSTVDHGPPDMSWLCKPEASQLIEKVALEMEDNFGLMMIENMDDDDEKDVILEENDDEIVASFFSSEPGNSGLINITQIATPGKSPVLADIPNLVLPHSQVAKDGEGEVLTMRHAEALSARVRRISEPDVLQLRDAPKAPRKQKTEKLPRQCNMYDEVIDRNEPSVIELKGALEYPAYPFEFRALTFVSSTFYNIVSRLCWDQGQRETVASRLNIRTHLTTHFDTLKLLDTFFDPAFEQVQADGGTGAAPHTTTTPGLRRHHRDSEMDFSETNIYSSDAGSSEKLTATFPDSTGGKDLPTPSLALDCLSFTSPAEKWSQGTTSCAESSYDTQTWTLRCFISKVLREKAARYGPPVSVAFVEIVPIDRCTRFQAAITLRHILALASGGDIRIKQSGKDILISEGLQARALAPPDSSSIGDFSSSSMKRGHLSIEDRESSSGSKRRKFTP